MELHKKFIKGDIIIEKITDKRFEIVDDKLFNNSVIMMDNMRVQYRVYYEELNQYESEFKHILKSL